MKVDIKDLDKPTVLLHLYNNAKILAELLDHMFQLRSSDDPSEPYAFTIDQARQRLEESPQVDRISGVRIEIDFRPDEIDVSAYDDNYFYRGGEFSDKRMTAKQIIKKIRLGEDAIVECPISETRYHTMSEVRKLISKDSNDKETTGCCFWKKKVIHLSTSDRALVDALRQAILGDASDAGIEEQLRSSARTATDSKLRETFNNLAAAFTLNQEALGINSPRPAGMSV